MMATRPLATPALLGAKLGAILCGFRQTRVDAGGLENPSIRPVWTPVDAHGHGLEIYGSGGWVFESPRARCSKSLWGKGFQPRTPAAPSDAGEPS